LFLAVDCSPGGINTEKPAFSSLFILLSSWQQLYSRYSRIANITQTASVYGSNAAFQDVVPIPQDDGPHPLAQIAYSEHYAEAMSYLRALTLGEGEMSERALQLTGDIIAMNPAHYTVWYSRPQRLCLIEGHTEQESFLH
jgi:hypothetical protein